ncbi:tetratricopeptide repeat protein [candidate division KSB1 bacterium]|nr:tetratricopeptide repeat protein [candidate division KSB1 bacterium]
MKQLSTRPRFALCQIVTLAATIFALQGCGAYFNTFYNTKKLYKEALEEQKRRGADNKPTSTEIQKYDKAIEKASKLLQLHPKSRYVDDALLLLGECFFYKQEYLKAQRKFQELITIFPKSGLVPRAQIWLAKTNIELNDYAGAELVLNALQQREKKGELFNQAQYLLGEIYFRQERLPEAAKAFLAVARKLGDEKMRGTAFMRLGECCMALQQYDLAAGALRRAGAIAKNGVDFKFRARLQYADALKNNRQLNEALNVLNDMLKEFSTHRDLPLVKLEIADCTRLQGKIETAIKQYADVIENHQRTDASAAAFFELGEIHERYNGDYSKAKECYDNVRRESGRSDKVTEAASRSKALGDLIKLKETIATLERQREALARGQAGSSPLAVAAKGTASTTSQRSISHVPRRARDAGALQDAAKKSGDPNKLAAELAKSKILLAELFMFNFNNPDSAMHEYLDVFEFFPQTEYAPQAMYSLAYILGDAPATLAMRDSILQVLALQYGNTPQGRGAKWRLNGADTSALAVPSTPNLFRQAEERLIAQDDAQSAVQLYQEFLQHQPDPNPKWAAQSLYAIGWIYEHKLSDNKQALAAYKKLIETYPDSPMARRVRPKVTAVEQKKSEPAKVEPPQPDSTAAVAVAPPEQPAPALSDSLKAAHPLIDDEDFITRRRQNVEQPPKPDSSEVEKEMEKKKNEENKDKEPPELPPF